MTATRCAWCENHSSMILRGSPFEVGTEPESGRVIVQASFTCSHCDRMSIGSLVLPERHGLPNAAGPAYWTSSNSAITWTPASIGGRDFPDVPAPIGAAADEAYRCRSISALKAAILLARAVVEAAAKEKGIVTGTLYQKIEQLESQGFVRGFTKEAAHELRHLGNDMAHGDFVQTVDAGDCDAVLDVMSEILNEVYQGPARVSRMKQKRVGGF